MCSIIVISDDEVNENIRINSKIPKSSGEVIWCGVRKNFAQASIPGKVALMTVVRDFS